MTMGVTAVTGAVEQFDYAALDLETRIVVQQRTEEIRVLARRSAQDISDIGAKLIDVRGRLNDGSFRSWLQAEFDWSHMTAYRFIQVHERFGRNNLLQMDVAPSALYLLAAPSTPDDAVAEALERAEGGERITHATAKALLDEYRPATAGSSRGLAAGSSEMRTFSAESEAATLDDRHDARVGQVGLLTTFPIVADEVEAADSQYPSAQAGLADGSESQQPFTGFRVADGQAQTQPHATAQDVLEMAQPATDDAVPVSLRDGYDSDEWYTPAWVIEAARQVMGGIDLDPASCEMAQEVVQAGLFWSRRQDGARMRWFGRVWLNPPYSEPKAFVDKLLAEYAHGNVSQAVVLLNNATETSWFQALLARFPVCFFSKRLAFWRHDHADVGARQGQAVFYLGQDMERFCEVFGQFGIVVKRMD